MPPSTTPSNNLGERLDIRSEAAVFLKEETWADGAGAQQWQRGESSVFTKRPSFASGVWWGKVVPRVPVLGRGGGVCGAPGCRALRSCLPGSGPVSTSVQSRERLRLSE